MPPRNGARRGFPSGLSEAVRRAFLEIQRLFDDHIDAVDPHPQYAAGTAAELDSHIAAANPHSQYLRAVDLDLNLGTFRSYADQQDYLHSLDDQAYAVQQVVDHRAESNAHLAENITVQPFAFLTATDVQEALNALTAEVVGRIADGDIDKILEALNSATTVTNPELTRAGIIVADAIASGAVIAGKLAANAVEAGTVDADAITGREVNASSAITVGTGLESILLRGSDSPETTVIQTGPHSSFMTNEQGLYDGTGTPVPRLPTFIREMVGVWDARNAQGVTVPNLGVGGSSLDATIAGADVEVINGPALWVSDDPEEQLMAFGFTITATDNLITFPYVNGALTIEAEDIPSSEVSVFEASTGQTVVIGRGNPVITFGSTFLTFNGNPVELRAA